MSRSHTIAEHLVSEVALDRVYGSLSFRQAVSYAVYGTQFANGITLFVGSRGAGKTTVLRYLERELSSTHHVVFARGSSLANGRVAKELLESLGHRGQQEDVAGLSGLFAEVAGASRKVVMLIDDVINVGPGELGILLKLMEAAKQSQAAFSIVMALSVDAHNMLVSQPGTPLLEHIVATYHFEPLSESESQSYVKSRLQGFELAPHLTLNEDDLSVISQQTPRFPGDVDSHIVMAVQQKEHMHFEAQKQKEQEAIAAAPSNQEFVSEGEARSQAGTFAITQSASSVQAPADLQHVQNEVGRLREKMEVLFDEIMVERRRADEARAEADTLREKLHRLEIEQLRADAQAAKRVMRMLSEQDDSLSGQLERHLTNVDDV